MYQVEVKLRLIRKLFSPSQGWVVHCHLDGMELGKGGQQPASKAKIAAQCVAELDALGITRACHAQFPRADVVAIRSSTGEAHLVEVEGTSSRQREQAVYSALGQLLFKMCEAPQLGHLAYGLAVPDEAKWRGYLERIPVTIRRALGNVPSAVENRRSGGD